ncbi:MAG: threonylcarbamoyl-AMP synthase [Deltaproteobacteria bacterium]|nr:threonylcarbamoyl-AMP synthase [Deltaproteobacteria bacterium]
MRVFLSLSAVVWHEARVGAEVPDPAVVTAAARLLRAGGLVAIPTETVYGLAGDAANPDAVRRIFAAKGRPADHPLIVHVAAAAAIAPWAAAVPDTAWRLADAFWPGPLTLILPRSPAVSPLVTGGRDTVALRVPAHPLTRAILAAFGGGVAAPSANRFGRISPTTAAHVRADLGDRVDLVVDGGPCDVGIESTIVDLSVPDPAILRLGAVTADALAAVLGRPVAVITGGPVKAPGQLPSHYAPRAALEVVTAAALASRVAALEAAGARVAAVGYEGEGQGAHGRVAVPTSDLGYARALYAALRAADADGVDVIVMVEPPDGPLAEALRDRLGRAAAPRPGDHAPRER